MAGPDSRHGSATPAPTAPPVRQKWAVWSADLLLSLSASTVGPKDVVPGRADDCQRRPPGRHPAVFLHGLSPPHYPNDAGSVRVVSGGRPSDFVRLCQPVPSGGDRLAWLCELGLCFSKQFGFCSGGHVYCARTHPQHTTVRSGSVSICGLSVAVERDDPHAQGWLADVTTSVHRQDGGDRMRIFSPSIQATVVESPRTKYRFARDLDCGESHLTVFFTT